LAESAAIELDDRARDAQRKVEVDELDEADVPDHIEFWRHVMAFTKSKSGRSGKHGAKRRVARVLAAGRVSEGTPSPGERWKAAHTVEVKGVLSGFDRAVLEAKRSGKPFQMTVVVEPYAASPKIVVEKVPSRADDGLDAALAAAKTRGAARVADILNSKDMLTADAFAEEIGATRETVHKKRRRHEVLGLEGPKRGVRFPKWQLSQSGELLPSLPLLFQTLGGHPWAVYRFLLQGHAELGGRSALDALRRGRIEDVIAVAETISSGAFV
jgi:hypothetical protein